jgi:hypothetical protein
MGAADSLVESLVTDEGVVIPKVKDPARSNVGDACIEGASDDGVLGPGDAGGVAPKANPPSPSS